jgi:hypothetical protein
MMASPDQSDPTPPDCFRLEDITTLRASEGAVLAQANYYIWKAEDDAHGFLFFLELIFTDHTALMLSSGEDSLAIRISDAATLVNTAQRLQALHGVPIIARLSAQTSQIWQNVLGKTLQSVHLTKHDNGLYANSAVRFLFENQQITVMIGERGGLELSHQ